ncbi:Tctex1 domain containing 1 [Phyllostomus discolor]|uniref:Tctex1 domain containing 1 n=1 Tax=Phyllostomus discolor TaxID=89673 RepID=A0A834AC81_9CHIR|nr:Tctex1 domain containing 1 [Phyllostomus discolor]
MSDIAKDRTGHSLKNRGSASSLSRKELHGRIKGLLLYQSKTQGFTQARNVLRGPATRHLRNLISCSVLLAPPLQLLRPQGTPSKHQAASHLSAWARVSLRERLFSQTPTWLFSSPPPIPCSWRPISTLTAPPTPSTSLN